MTTKPAETNQRKLIYATESTWGTKPASGWKTFRSTGDSLDATQETTVSEEIRSDRMTSDVIRTSFGASGSIDIEMSYSTYDDFLASVLYSSWQDVIESSITATAAISSGTYDGMTKITIADNLITRYKVGQWIKTSGATGNNATYNSRYRVTAVVATGSDKGVYVDGTTLGALSTYTNFQIDPFRRLINGTTASSYSIQKQFDDLTNQIVDFAGMRVSTFELSVAAGERITGTIGFLGKDMSIVTSAISNPTAANTKDIMSSGPNVNSVLINEVDVGSISNLSMNIDNNLRALQSVGEIGATNVNAGTCSVTGNLATYLKNLTEVERFIDGDAMSLSFDLNDETNYYTIFMPKCKYSAMSVPIAGANQDVIAEGEFQALAYTGDTAIGDYQIMITADSA